MNRSRDTARIGWLFGLTTAAYGLAFQRYLYEAYPGRFSWAGQVLPVVIVTGLVALLGGAGWAGLYRRMVSRSLSENASPNHKAGLAGAAFFLLLPLASVLDPEVNLLKTQTLLSASAAGAAVAAMAVFTKAGLIGRASSGGRGVSRSKPGAMDGVTHRPPSPGTRTRPMDLAALALVGVPIMLLYLKTLAPTVGEADTFEFQVNVARLAVAHPTGYPLFILLGKLFSWLPVGGTLAFRVNLASAAFGVVAALLGFAVARHLGLSRSLSIVTGLLIGLSPTLWSRAVEAEVYSLHAAIVAALLLWCLLLLSSRNDGAAWWHRPAVLIPLIGLTFGLGLSNHLTTLLFAPAIGLALLVFVLRSGRGPLATLGWRTWALALAGFALGLAVYLYIPLRWPAINHGEIMTLGMFRDYITGREPQGAFNARAFYTDLSRYGILGRKVVDEFGIAGTSLAVFGIGWLFKRNWAAGLVTLTAYLGLSFFPLSFYVPDPDFSAFLIAPHFIEAAWIGLGAAGLIRAFGRWAPAFGELAHSLGRAAFLLLPLSLIWNTYDRVDKSHDWEMYRLGQTILAQPLAQGAMILADSQKIAPLFYLQVAEGVRPDLDIRVLPGEADYRAALDEGLANGQTVYLGRYLPGLAGLLHLRSVGPLVEASPTPLMELPSGVAPLDTRFGDSIQLLGLSADRPSSEAGGRVAITLFWKAAQAVDGNYLVHLRLVDRNGKVLWSSPPRVPAGGLNPTFAWTPPEIIPDFHFVELDPGLAPGEYELEAGLFPPFSTSALPADGGGPWARVASIMALPPKDAAVPSTPLRAHFGADRWLLGYDAPESVTPGADVPVTLYWRDASPETGTARVQLSGAASPDSAELDLGQWPPGQTVPVTHVLRAPAEGSSFDLSLGLQGERAQCSWLGRSAGQCRLATIRIEGEAADKDAVNFGNRILLTEATLETSQAAPGGKVEVSIRWRGLKAMTEDYTAFVHLIGPDGLVHGQTDSWPVSGTLATSAWTPGRSVDDRYTVFVPADAPPGQYHVEIGWYLLATLDRLPVLDSQGTPIDDRLLLSGLEIR